MNKALIPDRERAEILASYVAAVKESPDVYRALQQRGELGRLDDVGRQYAEAMVVEVEAICAKQELEDDINRLGFWGAWNLVTGRRPHPDGTYWLPSRGITLDPPVAADGLAKQRTRKVGFEPPERQLPPPPPPPVIVTGLTGAEVERIVAAAVSAAIAKPTTTTKRKVRITRKSSE